MPGKNRFNRLIIATAISVILGGIFYGRSFFHSGLATELSRPDNPESFRVISTSPENGAKGEKLYRPIKVTVNRDVETAEIKVTNPGEAVRIPGFTAISGSEISFTPSRAFLPGRSYIVEVSALSKTQELMNEYEFSFATTDLGNKYWVDVTLGNIHIVRVYKGTQLVRHMLASGGKSSTPTPLGYFYTQDRGHSFWSPRFGEGANWWVRLVGQILVHSVPKNSKWMTKEEEHALLGLPASHGCIRLDEKDAKWFYENIPKGTMVIIHK